MTAFVSWVFRGARVGRLQEDPEPVAAWAAKQPDISEVKVEPLQDCLEHFERLCNEHDLTFHFSDDGSVWRRGQWEYDRIRAMAKRLGPEHADTCKSIWNAVAKQKIHSDHWEQFAWRE